VGERCISGSSDPVGRGGGFGRDPVQFRVDKDVQLVDDQTCPFPITLNYHVKVSGRDFYDNGTWVGAIVEQRQVGTDTANGVTLPDADHYIDHFTPKATARPASSSM
jgi:hypothetical protein